MWVIIRYYLYYSLEGRILSNIIEEAKTDAIISSHNDERTMRCTLRFIKGKLYDGTQRRMGRSTEAD